MKKRDFLHKVTSRLRYNPFWMGLLKFSGTEIKEKKWIFITGCYNSGTTLLDQILASHPQISGLPDEGVMLTNQLVRPEDFGWRRMWSKCELEMKTNKRSKNRNAITIKKHWSHFYDLQKEFLLEKSISNSTRLDFFNENFQPAYFIHIVRNGYAVAEGIKRKAQIIEGNPYNESGTYPISICAEQWVRSLQLVEQFKKNSQNFIQISYEDLSENPVSTINQILDKLLLDRFSEDHFTNSFTVHEKKSKILNMNEAAISRLNFNEKEEIDKVAGNYLSKYNYNR